MKEAERRSFFIFLVKHFYFFDTGLPKAKGEDEKVFKFLSQKDQRNEENSLTHML